MKALSTTAGIILILSGALLTVASLISIGKAQTWDKADEFAIESRHPVRRLGMLLGAVGLALLVASSPAAVAWTYGNPAFGFTASGWTIFAFSTTLFSLVLGVTGIVMPALGELALRGEIKPQIVANEFTRQPAIIVAFICGNLMYLSWIVIGIGLIVSQIYAPWLGWLMIACAISGWLGFLHVPVFQLFGSQLWAVSVIILGGYLLWLGIHYQF